MNTKTPCLVRVAAAALIGACMGNSNASATVTQQYSIQPLPMLPGMVDVYAKGINNAGQIVGYQIDADGFSHATLWDNSGAHELPYLSDNHSSEAYRINNVGQIVGKVNAADGNNHAALWTVGGATVTDIGTLPGGNHSFANDINDNGVVGGSSGVTKGSDAFTWTAGGGFVDYGNALPGSALGQAGVNGINNDGLIVGTSYVIFSPYKAAMARPGDKSMTQISPAGQFSDGMANAVNNAGVIVGYQNSATGPGHAAIFNGDGTYIDLGAMGMDESNALDINDSGQIVGTAITYDPDLGVIQKSFFYDGNEMADLSTLLVDGLAWSTLFSADAINDNGVIVGTGVFDDQITAYVATPVPEPVGLALFSVAAAGALLSRRLSHTTAAV